MKIYIAPLQDTYSEADLNKHISTFMHYNLAPVN